MTARRWIGALALLTAAATGLSTPAAAMTSTATADGDAHPAVVAVLQLHEDGVATAFCSGALLSPSVVVTASHCAAYAATMPAGSVYLTNDPTLTDSPDGRFALSSLAHVSAAARIVVNPRYKPGVGTDSYREDVSAIVVASPGALARPGGISYPSLPAAGVLDRLQSDGTLRELPIQVMGYGTEAAVNGAGGQTFAESNERRSADLTISALNQQVIHESQQLHQGYAGACYGDSGGPTFATVDGAWTILGVTSTGDIPCWATNTASRIDRSSVLDFLAGVLGS